MRVRSIFGGPRHRAPTPLFVRVRGIASGAVVVASVTLVAAAVSGGTFAVWQGSQLISPQTVVSGSAAITVAETFNASQWSNLLVGESVRQPFTVTNTGSVPLTLTATGTSSTSTFEIRVAPGSCSGLLAGAAVTSAAASLGTLASGATATQCLQVSLVSGAAVASSSNFSVVVSGTQAP